MHNASRETHRRKKTDTLGLCSNVINGINNALCNGNGWANDPGIIYSQLMNDAAGGREDSLSQNK